MNKIQDKYKRFEAKTASEKFVTCLCDNTFFDMWVYPNVYKEPGKEFCDCLVIFENNILIFSVKDYKHTTKITKTTWERWKRKAIDGSIKQINGAEKWIKNHPQQLFLDSRCTTKIPVDIDIVNSKIYRFIISLGMEEELFFSYSENEEILGDRLCKVCFDKNKIYHVLNSIDLEIILKELDTTIDFINFYKEKELTIHKLDKLEYCGEASLLALYINNMNDKTGEHQILPSDYMEKRVKIDDNLWINIETNPQYILKKQKDCISYLIDNLIKKSFYYEKQGELLGNIDIINKETPLKKIAKETRFQRRILAESLVEMYDKYWNLKDGERFARMILAPSFDNAYVLLVCKSRVGVDIEYIRVHLRKMLNIACGCLKNKNPELKYIIGIGFIPHDDKNIFSMCEDYILLNCDEWNEDDIALYNELNQEYRFWKNNKNIERTFDEYPQL